MTHTLFMAGVTALAFSIPALAGAPTRLHPDVAIAQAQTAGPPSSAVTTPSGTTVIIAPNAPPAPQSETPPPPPSPSYVWNPGHWYWTGTQFAWEPGKYVEKPTVSATFVPGHWEQSPTGWTWIPSRWDYVGVGSSTPPGGALPRL